MANPHWRVWVDWNGNGIWGEDGEDVTADLTRAHWEWGRELGRDRAQPGLLELTLRNSDHRYSPPYTGSPLYSNLKAGRKVWGQFAYPHDDFTGVDGANLADRATPVDPSFTWVKHNAGSNGFEISGNQARAVAGGSGEAIYTLDLGDADAYIGFQYNRASNAGGGVALRFLSPSDYLRVRFGDNGTVLQDVTRGRATTIRSGGTLTAGVNYFVEIEMHGPVVRLMATDLDAGSMERRTILDGGGNAGHAQATRHGLWHSGPANNDRWDDFGGWRSFFYGQVESIAPHPDRANRVCRVRAHDELQRLGATLVFNLLSSARVRANAIAGSILNWSGFNVSHRILDEGRVLVANQPRALWRISARDALYRLQNEEDGFLYIDGEGYFRLEASGHRDSGSHTVSRATFRGAKDESPYFSNLSWDDGSEGVENDVTFRYHPEDNQGLQEIWQLRDVPAIPAGESRDFLAESTTYDVVDGIRVPSATTDYTANSQADGDGTDMTGNLTVTLPLTSAFRGKGTVVRAANDHATDTAYVTFLRLRADRSYRDFESTIYQAEDSASQEAHGSRSRLVDCLYLDTYATAREVAEARLGRKKARKTRLALTLPNGDRNNLLQMVHRVLSDRITVVYPDMGIDQDFFIEWMELDVEARTGEFTMRWLVEGV